HDYAEAMTFEHAQIVWVEFRFPVSASGKVGPIPPMDRQLSPIGDEGIKCDLADRRIVVANDVTAQANDTGETSWQPAIFTVPGSGSSVVAPVLDPRKVLVHLARRPGPIASRVFDRLPSAVVRADDDHRVMRRATTPGARARIIDPMPAGLSFHQVLWILLLPLLVCVVSYIEVEAHLLVFSSASMKHRDFVVPVHFLWIGVRVVVAAGLKQQHAVACFGQARGKRATSSARP